ncbi:NucA/NucB deoxyribonuclease domain-containing protein (plasmid) [Streptomycetaceae bacterium NBC_01309]
MRRLALLLAAAAAFALLPTQAVATDLGAIQRTQQVPPLPPTSPVSPNTPMSKPTPLQDSCPKLLESFKQRAPSSTEIVTCVRSEAPSTPVAKEAARQAIQGVGVQEAAPPAWCTEAAHMDGNWWFTRFDACRSWTATALVYEGAAYLGLIQSAVFEYVYTGGGTTGVAAYKAQISILPNLITPGVPPVVLSKELECTGACTRVDGGASTKPVVLMQPAQSEGGIITSPGIGSVAATEGKHVFNYVGAGTIYTEDLWSLFPVVRCDNALQGITGPGCVFYEYKPTLAYSYSRAFDFGVAMHVGWSLWSGLPGGAGSSTYLHRTGDADLNTKNRNRACPSNTPQNTYPRPEGYSCDEYPFASTLEGAWTASPPKDPPTPWPARTFDWCQLNWANTQVLDALSPLPGPAGFSRCNIPAQENTNGGQTLNNFYRDHRINAGDAFQVGVYA